MYFKMVRFPRAKNGRPKYLYHQLNIPSVKYSSKVCFSIVKMYLKSYYVIILVNRTGIFYNHMMTVEYHRYLGHVSHSYPVLCPVRLRW